MAHLPTNRRTQISPLERAWRELETAIQVEGMARRAEARGLNKANGLYHEAARHHAEALRLQSQFFDQSEAA